MNAPCTIQQPVKQNALIDATATAGLFERGGGCQRDEVHAMTAQIVQSNRSGGPEGVIDAVEQRAPNGFDNIDNVLSYEERKAIVRGYAAKAGFAKEQVNRPTPQDNRPGKVA